MAAHHNVTFASHEQDRLAFRYITRYDKRNVYCFFLLVPL